MTAGTQDTKPWYKTWLLIPAILFLPFTLMYLTWKANWPLPARLVVIFIIFVTMVAAGSNSESQPSTTVEVNPSSNPAQTETATSPSPQAELSVKDKIVALAQKKIDKEVEVNFDKGTGVVIATISSSDHAFFNNTAMVNGIWDFFVPMAKEAFTYEGVNQIKVVITGEFIDQYGKSEVGNAVYVDMTKADFEMFNWDNLKFTNPKNNTELLTKSNFYVHPAIYKDIDPEKLKLSFL